MEAQLCLSGRRGNKKAPVCSRKIEITNARVLLCCLAWLKLSTVYLTPRRKGKWREGNRIKSGGVWKVININAEMSSLELETFFLCHSHFRLTHNRLSFLMIIELKIIVDCSTFSQWLAVIELEFSYGSIDTWEVYVVGRCVWREKSTFGIISTLRFETIFHCYDFSSLFSTPPSIVSAAWRESNPCAKLSFVSLASHST